MRHFLEIIDKPEVQKAIFFDNKGWLVNFLTEGYGPKWQVYAKT